MGRICWLVYINGRLSSSLLGGGGNTLSRDLTSHNTETLARVLGLPERIDEARNSAKYLTTTIETRRLGWNLISQLRKIGQVSLKVGMMWDHGCGTKGTELRLVGGSRVRWKSHARFWRPVSSGDIRGWATVRLYPNLMLWVQPHPHQSSWKVESNPCMGSVTWICVSTRGEACTGV